MGQPGNVPLSSIKRQNRPKMMAKLTVAVARAITGRHSRGKLIFLSRLAFSMNMFCPRVVTSAK